MAAVRFALALAGWAVSAHGAESVSWHSIDVQLLLGKQFDVTLHARSRTRNALDRFDQLRTGPILRWRASTRLTPQFGFYYQPQSFRPDGGVVHGRRWFGGFESVVAERGAAVLSARALWERFLATERPRFDRYRTLARLMLGRGARRPYAQTEWFFVREGFQAVRNSAGVRWQVSGKLLLETEYLHETRRAEWGGNRHIVVTSLQWRRAER